MGLNLGIILFAKAPSGEPREWAARLFPPAPEPEAGEHDPLCLPADLALLGTHQGRGLIVTRHLPWSIVSEVLMPDASPPSPIETWLAACSHQGDVLVASMHANTRSCGHAVFRGGELVLKVCRLGMQAGAHVQTSKTPAWYPHDPVLMLQPYRAYMEPEELELVPDVLETTEVDDGAFLYDANYVRDLARALLGASLDGVLSEVAWVCVAS